MGGQCHPLPPRPTRLPRRSPRRTRAPPRHPFPRARAVVDLFDRSVDERYGLHAQVLATRRDVAELETRLDAQTALLLGAMKLF